MNGLMRRVTAFLLGVVVGVVALAGGISSGAMWAYRNVKPAEVVSGTDYEEGSLKDASLEEMIEILKAVQADPSAYDLARLEKEFDFSVADLLANAGVELDKVDEKDLEAFKNISVFSLFGDDGLDDFLKSVKIRSLFVFIPAVSDKSLDEILSKEAQEILGERTLAELFSVKEGSSYIGLFEAVRRLKMGAIFPNAYDAVYDENKHEYTYVLKEGRKKGLAELMGDLPLTSVFNLVEGSSLTKEFMEGSLKFLAEKPISTLLNAFAMNLGIEEAQDAIFKFSKAIGDDVTLLDIVERKADGGYALTPKNFVKNFNVGYLLGYEKGIDGVWYTDETKTKPVEGFAAIIADMNIEDIFDDKETVDAINALFGDVTVKTLFDSLSDEPAPFVIEVLGDMAVKDVLAKGSDGIAELLVENLDLYVSELDLGDVMQDLLDEQAQSAVSDSAFLTALMTLNFGDFLKKEYTEEIIIKGFENALGGLSLGALTGREKDENGKWIEDNAYFKLLLDITVTDVLNAIRSETPQEALDHLFGDLTLGDIFGAAFDYEKNSAEEVWHRGNEKVTEGFDDFLDIKITKLIMSGDKTADVRLDEEARALSVGDVLYSLLQACGVKVDLSYKNGKVYSNGDEKHLTETFLNITFGEYIDNFSDGEWWWNVFGALYVGDVASIISDNLPQSTVSSRFGNKWVVNSEHLKTLLDNLYNTYIKDLALAFERGDVEFFKDLFGDTDVGEIVELFYPNAENDQLTEDLNAALVADIIDLFNGIALKIHHFIFNRMVQFHEARVVFFVKRLD